MNFLQSKIQLKRPTVILQICATVASLIMILMLVSCQTGRSTVSLDEAKKISLQFSSASFIPPPRSINDLRKKIGTFSFEKELGDCNSSTLYSLEELFKILQNAPPWPADNSEFKVLRRQAYEDLDKGNYARGFLLLNRALAALPDGKYGHRANMLSSLAKLQAYAGDFDSAEKTLHSALLLQQQHKWSHDPWSRLRLNSARAVIEQLKGNFKDAELYLKKGMAAIEEIQKRDEKCCIDIKLLLQTDLAENLMLQDRLLEAEILAREILNHATGKHIQGKALLILSRILFAQGRYSEAEYIARAAINSYLLSYTNCSSIFLNLSRQTVARSLIAQERWEEAIAQFETIREEMQEDPKAFESRFTGDVDWAMSLLAAGRQEEAANMLHIGLERTKSLLGEKHYHTAEIQGLLAITFKAKGERERALKTFMNAVSILLSRGHQTDDESFTVAAKDRRLTQILEAYMGLLADIHGTEIETKAGINALAEAFRLADVARNRSVLAAVNASSIRSMVKDPELTNLVRHEQDVRKKISALRGALTNAVSQKVADWNPKVIESLRKNIDLLRDAHFALIEEIENRFPEYAKLINPSPLSLENIREALVLEESLVSIYIGHDRSYIWAVPTKGEVAFASVPLGRKDVEEMVAKVRYALEPNAKTLGEISEFDLDTAYAIYQTFLKPVREGWKDAKSLLVVPHGALGYLPLSLLPMKLVKLDSEKKILFSNYQDVPWLVRSHAVTVLPSASSLVTLRALPPSDLERHAFVGFGDPYFSEQQAKAASKQKDVVQIAALEKLGDYALRGISIERIKTAKLDSAELALLPRLPETADEIRSIALALNADLTKDIFTGTQANEQQVKTMDLSGYKVIAFATHGLAPGDLNGLLQPALALSSPQVAGIEGDGLLTMGEILGLRLNADWVVLSACNTGAGKESGAEALSGLGRAFFYAGARALLVSNWPVETTSAKLLTTDLFRRQAENSRLSRAEALRQTMLSLIDGPGYIDLVSGKVVFSYAHPIFWAPFALVGEGSSATPLNRTVQ